MGWFLSRNVAELSARKDVKGLARLLAKGDKHGDRMEAAAALGEIRGERAVEALVACVEHDEEPRVRARAAAALGQIGDTRAIPVLIRRLGDAFLEERGPWAVVSDYGYLEPPGPDRTYTVRVTPAKDALIKIGAPAVEPLLTAVRHGATDVIRGEAVNTVVSIAATQATIQDQVVQSLVSGLSGASDEVREAVARALRWLSPAVAVDPLIGLLADRRRMVRRSAAESLERLSERRQGQDASSWTPAAQTRVVDALMAMLKEELVRRSEPDDMMERDLSALAAAAKALATFAEPRSADLLVECATLDECGAPDCTEVLKKIGSPAVPSLLKALESEHESVRDRVVDMLSEIRGTEILQPVLAMLEHPRAGVRASAAKLLGVLRDERAVDGLTAMLNNGEERPRVRACAAEALAEIGGNAAAAALAAVTNDARQSVREAVAQAIQRLRNVTTP